MPVASVVIVGAGIMGASVAYHLAARGWRDVLVLERSARPGEGSTGKATGGFRAQFSTPINVRLSLLAREKLGRFVDEIGLDPGYLPAGYLWIACAEAELAVLRAALRVQHAEGLHEAVEVSPGEIASLNPGVRLDGVVGGAFCPTDGFIHPMRMLEGYLAAARRLGVEIEWGVTVNGLEVRNNGRISTVKTSRGTIAADVVVNAAGAWAATVAGYGGVDLPVVPLRRQVAVTARCDLLPETMPMTVFASDSFHLRVRDGRVLLLWPTPGTPTGPFDTRVDPLWIDSVTRRAHERVPVLRQVGVDAAACWAGLYEMSPDRHAILGAAPGCANLFLINGSSGHGVMHAPALGQLLAEIISDGTASTLEVTTLRASRFAQGEPNPASELL